MAYRRRRRLKFRRRFNNRRRKIPIIIEKKFTDWEPALNDPGSSTNGDGGSGVGGQSKYINIKDSAESNGVWRVGTLAQGNSETQRDGNHVTLVKITYKLFFYQQAASPTNTDVLVKFALVLDKRAQEDFIPELAALLEGDGTVMEFNERNAYHSQFKTLLTKTAHLIADSPKSSKFCQGSINCNILQSYDDTAAADITRNPLYAYLISENITARS